MSRELIPRNIGLHRERLTRRLDLLPTARLGLVIAPAGSGKTALMADWARSFGPRGAWCLATREESGAGLVTRMSQAWGLPIDPRGGVQYLLAHLREEPDPHLLVIDDAHLLVQESARRTLQTLMRNAPPTTSILLGSRRLPDLDLVHCEVSVNPVVLSTDDLRFRTWEVENLFRDVYGEPLLPEEAAALARYTGGWAAALHLFHLSTAGRSSFVRRRAVHSLAGHSRYAADYLSRQVLVGLGPDRSEFLRRTAVFEVVTAARCNSLLTRADSQQVLTDLVAQQTLTSTDDHGATFYYHEVLRRHLEAELEAGLGEAGMRQWYGRAAELLEAEGALTEALRVRARARDWMGVRALLVRSGGEITSQASSWTGLLPTTMLHDDPWIELAQAQRLLRDGQLRAAGAAIKASLSQLEDPQAEERARDLRAVVRAWEVLGCPPTRRWYEQVAGGLRDLRVLPRTPSPGQQTEQDALARPFLALLHGNLAGALDAHRDVTASSFDPSPSTAALGLLEALIALLSKDPRARQIADAVATQAELDDLGWFNRASRSLLAATDPDRARGIDDLRRIRESCERRGDCWGAAWTCVLQGLGDVLAGGTTSDALDDAATRLRDLRAAVPVAWMESLAALVRARAGQPDSGERARAAAAHAEAVACPGAQAAAIAALAWVQRDPLHLRLAQARARENAVTFHPWQGWELSGPGAAPPRTARPSSDATRPAGGAAQLEIRLLGGFEMTIEGSTLILADLRPQVSHLLRVLALHAGEAVHRERLAEWMWPNRDPTDGIHRLQVAVSTLRRSVGDDLRSGSGQLVVREADCYRLRLTPASRVDVHEFRKALSRARRQREARDTVAEAVTLQEALDLYTGDLLPEQGPADWIIEERERLRVEASAAATALAALLSAHDPRGAVAAVERGLSLDPYNDAAWQRLISLHKQLGDLARSERARASYRDVLRELGVGASASEVPEPRVRNSTPAMTTRWSSST